MKNEHRDGPIDLQLLAGLNWLTLAVIAVTYYHYLITLHEEVRFVWLQKFSGATVIYLANRYVVLSSVILTSIFTFLHTDSSKVRLSAVCKAGTTTAAALLQSAQLIQGVFATLRMYAIRDQSIIPSVVVFILYTAAFVTRITWITPAKIIPYPVYSECLTYHGQGYFELALASRVVLMAADLMLLIFTYIKTCGIRQFVARSSIHLPLTMLLFRNGTMCFSVNFFLGVADLAFIVSGNLALSGAISPLIIVLRSFVVANFLVNLREVYFGDEDDTTHMSGLRFACTCIGNMGAPLSLPGAFDDTMVSLPHKSLDPLKSGLTQTHRRSESHGVTMMCCSDIPGFIHSSIASRPGSVLPCTI